MKVPAQAGALGAHRRCVWLQVRINFPEGSLIELNNQSKHAVDNCWDRHRVHLIFDYVEDFAIERIVLKVSLRGGERATGVVTRHMQTDMRVCKTKDDLLWLSDRVVL